jgi:predicted dehydrogenase
VVVIATPNGYHAQQALECLHAKNHVVVEKPMALRKQDAENIIF